MRVKELLDFNWRFYKGDLPPKTNTEQWGGAKSNAFKFGVTDVDYDDSKWRNINLPHDFVLEGNYTQANEDFKYKNGIPAIETIDTRLVLSGSLEGGIGWYRKKFHVPENEKGKRFYIFFDGVYRDSTVYLNHFFVGNHQSGYTSFYYDVTDFINYGGENLLALRVDSTGHEGWSYEGGGIYRHVWLVKTEPLHVNPWGTFVTSTFNRSEDGESITAQVDISIDVANRISQPKDFRLNTKIFDADDNLVAVAESDAYADEWDNSHIKQKLRVNDAKLWSIEHPNLYKAVTTILLEGAEVDRYETTFGVRSIYFDADKGFFLNGEPVKIKGVCCHQNHAGVGIALTERIIEYRLEKLKELGCNAYRCSHYPPAPELLDICDRLGILVMDENRILSSAVENIQQVKDMVLRDRNHPSIFIWVMGNEEGGLQQREEGGRICRTLRHVIRKLDPTRPVTMAIVFWDGVNKFEDVDSILPTARELDVMGFNYHEHLWDRYHKTMPHQPTIVSEAYSSMWTRGCRETDRESCSIFGLDPEHERFHEGERQWKMVAENPYLSGIFIWTGFDYRGEPSPFPWPAISTQFGIMDTCGFPKDNYYYYKSWWSNEDVLYIFPHWNQAGKVGKPVDVYCYSNCEEVELFLNGRSLGKKVMEKNWYLKWEGIIYEPGRLYAKGIRNNKQVCDYAVETTGAPYRIQLTADRQFIKADGVDVSIITAAVVDEEGRIVPTADNQIKFDIKGQGTLLGVGNGNPASHESDKSNLRRAFKGLCQLIVQSKENIGEIVISASSEQLLSDALGVNTL